MIFPDFEEFIASLNAHRVRYLIVGGYAVGFHAKPRATKHIDVLIDRSEANAGRARAALVMSSKEAAGRPQDLADLDVLRQVSQRRDRAR